MRKSHVVQSRGDANGSLAGAIAPGSRRGSEDRASGGREESDGRGAGTFHRGLHRLAWVLLVCAFPLIWMGGLVTSKGAGMSVPDWPNSFGYNMFALPLDHWIGKTAGGIFYEHAHRLLGTLVGLVSVACVMSVYAPARSASRRRFFGRAALVTLAIGGAIWATVHFGRNGGWIDADRARQSMHFVSLFGSIGLLMGIAWALRERHAARWVRRLCVGILVAVIVQGLMGGLRVSETSLLLAKLHGVFGQWVFAAAGVLVVVTSRWWRNVSSKTTEGLQRMDRLRVGRLRVWATACVVLVVMQLVLGAVMRHDPRRNHISGEGAGLAIPDWPLHYGKVLPPTDAEALERVNWSRVQDMKLPRVTMGQVWLHFSHRVGAYVTLAALLLTAWRVVKSGRSELRWMGWTLGLMGLVQVGLGVTTVLLRKPADIATGHQAVGALLLSLTVVLLVRVVRLYHVSGDVSDVGAEGQPLSGLLPGRKKFADGKVMVGV
jgi:cytochrome c oxidase assembly protein subunit 15